MTTPEIESKFDKSLLGPQKFSCGNWGFSLYGGALSLIFLVGGALGYQSIDEDSHGAGILVFVLGVILLIVSINIAFAQSDISTDHEGMYWSMLGWRWRTLAWRSLAGVQIDVMIDYKTMNKIRQFILKSKEKVGFYPIIFDENIQNFDRLWDVVRFHAKQNSADILHSSAAIDLGSAGDRKDEWKF